MRDILIMTAEILNSQSYFLEVIQNFDICINTQGKMADVMMFARADIFFTFIRNWKWPEISKEFVEHQNLRITMIWLLECFIQNERYSCGFFKKLQSPLRYMTEWPKRELHSHTLIWCKVKLRVDDFDWIILAELLCKMMTKNSLKPSIFNSYMVHIKLSLLSIPVWKTESELNDIHWYFSRELMLLAMTEAKI